MSGGHNKRFVIIVLTTIVLNFIFSYFISDKSGLLWILSGWNLYLAFKASAIHKKEKLDN